MRPEKGSGDAPRLFRALLRLYPRAFRERFGSGMAETFAAELRDARGRGARAVTLLWLRMVLRTPFLATEERWGALRGTVARSPDAGHRDSVIGEDVPLGERLSRHFDGWLQDGRFALRTVKRSPGFVVVAVLTISLGVGATASLFSVANALLLRPLPVLQPDRLVRVQEQRSRIMSSGMEGPRMPQARYDALVEATDAVFTGLAAQNVRFLSLRADGPAVPAAIVLSSGNYFEVLGLRPVAGRFFTTVDEPVVVLGYRVWQQRFGGSADVIGRTVHVAGQPFTVAGVAPAGFGGTLGFLVADAWIPYGAHGASAWPGLFVAPFGRLRPGVDAAAATAFVSAATVRIPPEEDLQAEVYGVELEPMTGMPATMAGAVRGFLGLLLATAFVVLLIGGANVSGMLLARAVGRRREMAVRLALGVGRARLVRQMLLEAVALFLIGGLGGLLVTIWATRLIGRLQLPVAEPVLLDAAPDERVLVFALAIALGTGLLFGLLPAWQTTRSDVAGALRDGGRGSSRGGARVRDVFVVSQLALSVLLLVAATLFLRTLQRSMSLDTGFDSERVLIATTNLGAHGYDEERGRLFADQLMERVRAHPGVESVGLATVALMTGENETFGAWRLVPDGPTLAAGQNVVDAEYFETMRFEIVLGRGISPTDREGSARVVVVNETFSRRLWPGESPIGKVVLRGADPHEVVGVVRDGAYVQFGEELTPFVFLSAAQRYSDRQVLHVRHRRGVAAAGLIADIRAAVAALDADVAVQQAVPLTAAMEMLLFPQRFAAMLIGLFGLLGLLLAAIGVYGVLAHHVAQRDREFGIRIALGADAGRLLRMVLRRGVLLAAAGCAAGLAGAAALTQFLQAWLYGVSPLDPMAFLGVPLVLGAVALLASTLPARRTLRLDPMEVLRRE